ncbi:ABC transporter permease [Fodinicola acaciae]|uniref:ABC transporter permease n=1 Tax=Fodinicola acaciae TaxID=2681555 RepID=UPI0013D62871|nr:ABC transporter permease [Fodinicola acaciae]
MRPNRTLALIRHNTGLLLAQPGPVVARLLMPVAMIAALKPIYEAAAGPSGTIGVIAGILVLVSLLTTGIVGTNVLSERLWGTWDRLRATARPFEIMIGKTTPLLAVLVVQQVIVLAFGYVAYGVDFRSVGLLSAVVLVWSCTVLSLGFALGALVKTSGALSAVQDIGSFFLSAFGGALIPLALLPAWLHVLAPLSPAYWAVSSLRAALTGDGATTALGLSVLALCTTAAATVTYLRLR